MGKKNISNFQKKKNLKPYVKVVLLGRQLLQRDVVQALLQLRPGTGGRLELGQDGRVGRRRRRRRRRRSCFLLAVLFQVGAGVVLAPAPAQRLRDEHQVVQTVVDAHAVLVHHREAGRDAAPVLFPKKIFAILFFLKFANKIKAFKIFSNFHFQF